MCPSNNITLLAADIRVGDTSVCGQFNATVTNITTTVANVDIASSLTFIATLPMSGYDVLCQDADLLTLEEYTINVQGERSKYQVIVFACKLKPCMYHMYIRTSKSCIIKLFSKTFVDEH